MYKKFISIIVALLLIPVVLALGNTEDNYFWDKTTDNPVTNVDMLLYRCMDEQCANVVPIWDGNSGANNFILNLQLPYTTYAVDYAKYFFADGYAPLGFKLNDNIGDGKDTVYQRYFSQVEDCNAPIENLVILNQAYQNEPLVINLTALLNSTTYSAFHQVNNVPYYIPDAYKDEYFSAQTLVSVEIVDELGNVVYQNSTQVNIYMDSEIETQFTWVPLENGTFTITVTTDVVDDQCNTATAQTQSTQAIINVLPERVRNQCIVLLNDLASNNDNPFIGETIEITYTKLNYCADNDGNKTSVPLDVDYTIRTGKIDEAGVIVMQNSTQLVGTSVDLPTLFQFDWTPTQEGWYTITVHAQSDASSFPGLENLDDIRSIEVLVSDYPTYNVYFTLSDRDTLAPIAGALINLSGLTMSSDAAGLATFQDLYEAANYKYIITHDQYQTISGTFSLAGADRHLSFSLIQKLAANSGTAYACTLGETIILAGSAAGGTLPYSYAWDLNNDNVFETAAQNTAYVCSAVGDFTANLRVTDALSQISISPAAIHVYPLALVADANGPYTCTVGETITLSGSATGGVQPYAYAWDIDNDNVFETATQNTAYVCSTVGDYTVNLEVTDSLGTAALNSATIAVTDSGNNQTNLTANPGASYNCTLGETITLSGSATGGVQPYAYAWDLNNDNVFETITQNTSYVCSAVGDFTVNLQVTDAVSALAVNSANIHVALPANQTLLVADANGPYTCVEGQTLTLSGSATGGTQPYSFAWDLNNDNVFEIQTQTATYVCVTEGTNTITLQVSDLYQTVTDTTVITITKNTQPPKEVGPDPMPLWKKQAGYNKEIIVSTININNAYDVYSDGYLDIAVTVKNAGTKTLDDFTVSAWIPDLGVYRSAGPFDLKSGKQASKDLTLYVPSASTGTYDVMITAGNDNIRRTIFREIVITQ
ncbi:MAG: hypothetical protein KJ601_04185 [Nanoarchaeota archaeon]|nr:hypothetical protein [Nanoarchaeota archaeon]MBU1704304.1 hypothetical protein [Nanoarchaeota archaeon]